MTYNVHSCIDMQGKNSMERIKELIKTEKPALVGLNEVECFSPRTRFVNQPKCLAAARNMMFHFGPTVKLGPLGFFGNALLSCYPIYEAENIRLPGKGERRCCLKSRVRIPGGILTVMVTHLGLNRETRKQQVAGLAEIIRREKNQVVLMGDFNCGTDELKPLLELLDDPGSSFGAEPTFPTDHPSHRIDYILISPGMKCSDYRTVPCHASDHLPVMAKIE